MNRFLIILIFMVTGCLSAFAQADTIFLKDGSKIAATVLETTRLQVKYKRADNSSGPTYVVPVSEINVIVYGNGRRETFQAEPVPVAAPAEKIQKRTDETSKLLMDLGRRVNFNGPRVGVSYFGAGQYSDDILAKDKMPLISQFGWHFETRIFTSKTGMVGLAQFLPLIGGMEQGMFIPSASAMFALRSRSGFEVSLGPVVGKYGLAVVAGISTCFRVEDLIFPITLSFTPSVHKGITEHTYSGKTLVTMTDTGYRISLFIGFNTARD